jgi:hypothetical protein
MDSQDLPWPKLQEKALPSLLYILKLVITLTLKKNFTQMPLKSPSKIMPNLLPHNYGAYNFYKLQLN